MLVLLDHLHTASTTTDPHQREDQLRAALAIPPGVLAENTDYDWIEPAREHLRHCTIQALLTLTEHREPARATSPPSPPEPPILTPLALVLHDRERVLTAKG